jgi:hypothetical protein
MSAALQLAVLFGRNIRQNMSSCWLQTDMRHTLFLNNVSGSAHICYRCACCTAAAAAPGNLQALHCAAVHLHVYAASFTTQQQPHEDPLRHENAAWLVPAVRQDSCACSMLAAVNKSRPRAGFTRPSG